MFIICSDGRCHGGCEQTWPRSGQNLMVLGHGTPARGVASPLHPSPSPLPPELVKRPQCELSADTLVIR